MKKMKWILNEILEVNPQIFDFERYKNSQENRNKRIKQK